MKKRCFWSTNDPLYISYHDNEWGKPVYDDETLFEFLVLESFQAGLSWITILKKRENFRAAFDQFDYRKIAAYDANKMEELRLNEGIVRNRLKIKAAVVNAQLFMEIQKEFGSFSTYVWSYVQDRPIVNHFSDRSEVPATTPISDALSKDLKRRGFKFVGSTIIYAFMQATGMVNDHTTDCFCH
ncbi:DNA-3-methyladenine glycosylase I [Polaribacter pacificus]|uniref:DNA-3-methyladenine glycosylase I n=1 Tax=Polaribacter pacificus TaxID=1775173 RepID=A0A917HYR6_9FLAO|nr:DNA-3-methyladenine glycosylase I [Polaribacter pacificus]GGG96417.1 DNA-3-methyladenine glycosylase I [Polaribacter pacificus]